MIKVEYLLVFDLKENICVNSKGLISLLSTHSDIEFKGKKIFFKGEKFIFNIEEKENKDTGNIIFHFIINNESVSEKFIDLNKSFRKVVGRYLKENYQIIWDGIGFEYSKELYPMIYELENLMRILISKFMLHTLGIDWSKNAIPGKVKENLRKGDKVDNSILYKLDFIDLGKYLFSKYSKKNGLELYIEEQKKEGFKNIKEGVDNYLSKNNWDRYFGKLLNIESNEFEKKWDKMYNFRNLIAHNKIINEVEYIESKGLCNELKKIIEKALKQVSLINVSIKEVENISKLNKTIDKFYGYSSNRNEYLAYMNDQTWLQDEERLANLELQHEKQAEEYFANLELQNERQAEEHFANLELQHERQDEERLANLELQHEKQAEEYFANLELQKDR